MRIHADHLVVQRARCDRIEKDPYAVVLDDLVVDDGLGGLLDLELDLAVVLDPANAQASHLA